MAQANPPSSALPTALRSGGPAGSEARRHQRQRRPRRTPPNGARAAKREPPPRAMKNRCGQAGGQQACGMRLFFASAIFSLMLPYVNAMIAIFAPTAIPSSSAGPVGGSAIR
eukprot:gene37255-18778_t